MEENLYTISIRIGLQTRFEFDGMLLSFDEDAGTFTFCENEGIMPKPNGSMIVLDLNHRAIAFSIDKLKMRLNMLGHKKAGDNYYFNCATDLCHVDVYVCEKTLFSEKGDAIFS